MTLSDIVERERRGVARHLGVANGAYLLAAALAVLLVGTVILGNARWLALPPLFPFLVWLVIATASVALFRRLRARARAEATVPRLAKTVEEERRLRAGSLRGVLEVSESGVLGRLGADQMTARLHAFGDGTLVPNYRKHVLRRAGFGIGAAAAGVLGVVSAAVAAPDGFRAVIHPVDAWRGTLLGAVSLGEVPPSVLRGERVSITVRAPGRKSIQVAQRVTGSSWRNAAMPVTGDSVVISLGPLDADVAVYATDGRSTSDTALVKVVDKPFVGDVTVRATFPGYLGRRPETVPLGELVRVPRGTALEFGGHSSTELRSISLKRAETTVLSMGVEGRSFSGQLVASTSGRYDWSATGVQGPIADLPPALDLEVLPDSAPQVEIISPSRDSTVSNKDSVSLAVMATDDHGLSGVVLRIALVNSGGDIRTSSTRAMSGATVDQFTGNMTLSMAALQPGDALRITALATDASPWRQVGTSRDLVLRLPSVSDQRAAARTAADSAVNKALAAANAQRQLNQRTADAARAQDREAQKNNPLSYQAAEQAKQFAKEQRQLADRMQQVQDAAKQLEKQLKEAGALDSALQNRLREAQRLMREALTPELAEKLRKLEEASKNMSPEDSRRALQDLTEQQKKLREMLDKSVEMLKRAAMEGQMETLKDEAQDLAKRQRELVDSLRGADQKEEQSAAEKMAKDLSAKAKELQQDVKELQKRLQQEKAEAGADRVREAGEKVDESLQKMQEALNQQNKEQGEQGQKQSGEKQQGEKQQGQAGAKGEQKGGEQKAGEQKAGEQKQKEGQQGQAGQQGQQGQQSQDKTGPGKQGNQKGEQSGSEAAEQAAQSMEQAANELSKAREQQVNEWKKELSGELDRSIQEMLQLAREQDQLEKSARAGAPPGDLRSQQSALQQGVEKAMQRLQEAGNKSSLLSQRSMRTMGDAKRKVEEATQQTQRAQTGQQMAGAMRESSEGLNQAAASLVRDRERTTNSNSSTGFAEMLEQLQQMAKQQQGINSAMQQLMPQASQAGQDAQGQARQLAKEQRDVAAKLDDSGDKDNSGRAEEMAREARQIAQQLESGQLDPAVLERQQRLFRKMLDAGRLLEEDEREDTGKREAKPWTGTDVYTPAGGNASGKAASRFSPPTWNDLRGLTPEERRLVLEYFKRINAKP